MRLLDLTTKYAYDFNRDMSAPRDQGVTVEVYQIGIPGNGAELTVPIGDNVISEYHLRALRTVSPRHAALRLVNDTLYLIDAGSERGTFVNGDQKFHGEVTELHVNDFIELGDYPLRVIF